jgi:hypothetical protein
VHLHISVSRLSLTQDRASGDVVHARDAATTRSAAARSSTLASIFRLAKKWRHKSSLFDFGSTVSLTPLLPRD